MGPNKTKGKSELRVTVVFSPFPPLESVDGDGEDAGSWQSSLPVPGIVQGRNEWAVFTVQAQSSNIPPNKHVSLDWSFCPRLLTAQENPQKTVASLPGSPTKKREIFYVFGVFFLRARRSNGTHAIRDNVILMMLSLRKENDAKGKKMIRS